MKIFVNLFSALIATQIVLAALTALEANGRGNDRARQALSMVPGDRLGVYRLSSDGAESLEQLGKPVAMESNDSETQRQSRIVTQQQVEALLKKAAKH